MFTEYTESIVYVALCLGVWGIGEGVGAILGSIGRRSRARRR
jgi:hypothetical protein